MLRMRLPKYLSFCILILFRLDSVQSGLVAVPLNRAVVVGQRMEMECRTDKGTKVREWIHQRHNASKIFTNFDTDPKRVDASFTNIGVDADANGSGFIYSNSTSLEEAGLYTCRVEEGQKFFSHTAQLIVLETNPTCETNQPTDQQVTVDENIWFKCSLEFSGNWTPTMEWRRHCESKVDVLSGGFVSTHATNSSVTSTLNLTVPSGDQWCNVSCRTYFSIDKRSPYISRASNTPDYNYIYVWNFPQTQSTMILSEKSYTTDASGYGSQESRTSMTILIVVLIAVSLVLVMIVAYFLHRSYYRTTTGHLCHGQSVEQLETTKKSQEKDFQMEIRSSNELSLSDNMDASQNADLAAIFVYLMTAMWAWLAVNAPTRTDFNDSTCKGEDRDVRLSYDNLVKGAAPPVNLKQRVSIVDYAEVPLCGDASMYSDAGQHFSQLVNPLWTPRYCGFLAAKTASKVLPAGIGECKNPTDPRYQVSITSGTPKMPRHHKNGPSDSMSTRDVNIDEALCTSQRKELQYDVTRDDCYDETDYLHFDNDAIASMRPTEQRSDVINDDPSLYINSSYPTYRKTDDEPILHIDSSYITCRTTDDVGASYLRTTDIMDSSYLTASDIMDSSYLDTAACMDPYMYIEMQRETNLMASNASSLQETRKPTDKNNVVYAKTGAWEELD